MVGYGSEDEDSADAAWDADCEEQLGEMVAPVAHAQNLSRCVEWDLSEYDQVAVHRDIRN
jgi:hypothetical protein